jgi:type VI secretion system protein ImpG
VTVDHRSFEYRLVADSRRERFTQIHSILEVTSTGAGEPEQRPFAPFFSFSHPNLAEGQARVFWTTRRLPNHRVDLPGSDVLLSFVDIDFHPRNPASDVLFARVLCTNRHLANEMEAGTVLALEQPAPVKRIECLTKPTPSVEPPSGGQALWRLVSNLSLNHLSIGGPQAVDAIREILRAYLFRASPSAERQIAAISSVRSRTVTGRVGTGGWRGPCRGTEVEIELDQPQFGDSSPLLFAEVLHRFLSLYAHLNSFTTLVLKSTLRQDEREEWKRWLPSAGAKPLL